MTQSKTWVQALRAKARGALSEDWVATLTGLAIVLVICSGVFGPGPQSAKLSAASGEAVAVNVRAAQGWTVGATLAGEKTPVAGAWTRLNAGQRYVYTCQDGQFTAQTDATVPSSIGAPAHDRAQIVLINGCGDTAAMTFKTSTAIRWPIFGVLDR